ncbi:TlpA family protein disulfide reductase [Hydrocarboniphaga sp.]|uniref:TlpA family protein disulfide reductase n=1 Tax=Hydrocarboniphaga sp. TaxID=2033016 RepID=UPI003D09D13F
MKNFPVIGSISLTFALSIFSIVYSYCAKAADSKFIRIDGHYSDSKLATFGRITLPRTFLYDSKGNLIAQEQWPSELTDLKAKVGDAFCCISPSGESGEGGEPPKDCVKIVYGADVSENTMGLIDAKGDPITLKSIPAKKYLLVEYFATWCPPCIEERKALTDLFATSPIASNYVWLSIDMSRMLEAEEAATSKK